MKEVYQGSMILTSIVAVFDGLNAAGISFVPINDLFATILPLYGVGLGWILPAIVGAVLGYVWGKLTKSKSQTAQVEKIAS
jgi:LIVCS family branched-chain amino acid:cation transporter